MCVNELLLDLLAIEVTSRHALINKGGTVQFTANASGVAIVMYQWRKRDVDNLPDKVSGKDTLVLTIPNIDESDEGEYYCIVTNMWNRSLESNHVELSIYGMVYLLLYASLFILYGDAIITGPPTITTHPSNTLITNHMSVTLDCDANGTEPITFRWENSIINGGQWMNISNSDGKKLVVKALEQSEQYRCVASNDAGETSSNIANITVLSKYL